MKDRVVLFDLDGTLLNSIEFILECFRHSFEVCGLPPKPDAYWKRTIGTPIRQQLDDWEYGAEKLEEVLTAYRHHNSTYHDERIAAYDGVKDLLIALTQQGIRIGVVTSKSRAGARRGLETTGLSPFVHELVSVDDVTRGKPDPEPVLTAVARFRADPGRTFFVGDSIHDMLSGRAAEVRTVAALWGPFERSHLEPGDPEFWCERPGDVLPVVRGRRRER